MTYLEELQNIISDMYKDVNGIRPRGERFWSELTTVEACRSMLDDLEVDVVEAIAAGKAREERAVNNFEKHVAETIELGAGDRATAIRWIMDAYGEPSADYLEWVCNLSMGYLARVAA